MKNAVESKSGRSLVMATNLILLAALLAALTLGAVILTAEPADARATNIVSSVEQTNWSVVDREYKTKRVLWKNRPRCCGDMVNAGIRSWDGLGGVDWVYRSKNPTLRFRGSSDPPSATRLGVWSYNFVGTDVITFYPPNFRNINGQMPQADRNWLGRHETGHALSYLHPYNIQYGRGGAVINERRLRSAANQRCCVMHTYHIRQNDGRTPRGITYLTSDDRYHHRIKW